MSDTNWQRVETIVDQALELPERKRKSFVKKQCNGKPELKSEITQLLQSIFDSEGWLENPGVYKQDFYDEIAEDVGSLSPKRSLINQKVGGYTIKKELGTGGMGSVYMAERSEKDFDHRVAIKIIRDSRATPSNIRRFKREQQILANLNHSGIARLFDGGISDDGTPYIIMEYVDGVPIDEYCQDKSLTLQQKIDLFTDVLVAVRYAHENLVVHRDLKPGNILVNKEGNIKILDFGISKLLKDDQESGLTQTGARLLTPRYASPEQVRQENITTSSDLYALGIIFHKLLTGTHPFDFEDLSRYEMERTILNRDPKNPSSYAIDAKTQNKLQGDLDAIILKALRKEPNHRYRVANEFLEDLKNYRSGVPISAREDSFRYRSQKFIKRHKKGIATAIGIVILVIGFSGFYTWRITQEKNIAQLEARKATQIKNLFGEILQQHNAYSKPNRELTLSEALDNGVDNLQHGLDGQPQIKAELLGILADNYLSLGDYKRAKGLVTQALSLYESGGLKSGEKTYIKNLQRLGGIYHRTGRFDKSEETYLKAISETNNGFYSSSSLKASIINNLALVFSEEGKLKKSEQYYRNAIQIADSSQKVTSMMALGNLSRVYARQGKYEKAIELEKESMQNVKELFPPLHPYIANSYNNLAFTYQRMGKLQKADSLHHIALKMRRKLFEPDHPHIASSLVRLGLLKIKQFHIQEAEKYLKEGYEILDTKLPEGHWQILSAKGGLAISRAMQGKFENNIPILENVYNEFCNRFGPKDWRSRKAASALNNLYQLWGKPQKAEYYVSKN